MDSLTYSNPKTGYFYQQTWVGMLNVQGKTRADFLQRQTSNDIQQISTDQIITSVLTSSTGRILDIFYLFENYEGDELVIQAITLPERAPMTASYFNSRIFFMDQVKLKDTSTKYTIIDLGGNEIAPVINRLGFGDLPKPGQLFSSAIDGESLKIFMQNDHLGLGYRLIAPSDMQGLICKILLEMGLETLSAHQYEVLRIEAGLPAAGHELTEEYTPLEVNLENAISENKGCYTGQEVIARQLTYDKVTRRLVGVELSAEIPPGAQLFAAGKPAGTLTSVIESPRFGWIGLAIIKRPYHLPGTELGKNHDEISATTKVVQLPFTQEKR